MATEEASVRYPTEQRERAKCEGKGLACIEVRWPDGYRGTITMLIEKGDGDKIWDFAVKVFK